MFPSGATIYSYVGGNPVNRIDPTGKFAWILPIIGGSIGIGDVLPWIIIGGEIIYYNELPTTGEEGEDDGSDNEEPKAPQPGERAKSTDNPLEQLHGIRHKQKTLRKNKKGEGVRCIKKSEDRVDHYLDRLTPGDAYDEDCGC